VERVIGKFCSREFLVLLRPFKVADFVTAAGVTGTIEFIGLFGTTINTPDNVQTIIGNNKILSDNISK
jgi:small conductance mechanosensitive channel